MLIGLLSFFLLYYLAFYCNIFKAQKIIEETSIPKDGPFSISTMPFSIERIVYYVSTPSQSLGQLPQLYEHLHVEYVSREVFDNQPFAIQVYYVDDFEKRIVAELLYQRFEVPYLDSLYGENQLTKNQLENLREFKFTHESTRNMLKDEVFIKLLP